MTSARISVVGDASVSTASAAAARAIVRATLDREERDHVAMRVAFVERTHIRALNRRYRGKDYAANVLSFPGSGEPMTPRSSLLDLGDVVIAPIVAAREAAEANMDAEVRLAHLIVHGTLHLLGFDHERNAADARRMEAEEDALLQSIPTTRYRALRAVLKRFAADEAEDPTSI